MCIHLFNASVNVKKSLFFLLSLVLFVSSSTATSLGRHSGSVLLGRPLEISVPAVIDVQEDPTKLCLQADVFYAEQKIDSARISVVSDKKLQTTPETLVFIRANVLVNEPIITVYLRVGCMQKVERRYVVLADFGFEANTQPASVPSFGSTTGTAAPLRVKPSSKFPVEVKQNEADKSQSPVPRAKQQGRQLPARPTNEKNSSRLKLESINSTIDFFPKLKLSAELNSEPADLITQERRTAAALWKALAVQPETIIRDVEKLQALDLSVRNLQAQTQNSQQVIKDLNDRIKKLSSERYLNTVVYSLSGLLIVVTITLSYLMRRRLFIPNKVNENIPWWHKNESLDKGWANKVVGSGSSSLASDLDAYPKNQVTHKKFPLMATNIDFNTGFSNAHLARGQKTPVAAGSTDSDSHELSSERLDFSVSKINHSLRTVKAVELFDVQQQADFFVSLGQYEQAIDVLRSNIGENSQASAVVYLDLFGLYHQLKRQADYYALRVDFNQFFNAKIPDLDLYNDSSRELETYQVVMSRIKLLWNSPKILDIIETSIFKNPDTNSEVFELEAYRELLLLYAVAKEGIASVIPARGEMMNFDLPLFKPNGNQVNSSNFLENSISTPSSLCLAHEEKITNNLLSDSHPSYFSTLSLDVDLSQFGNEDKGLKL